MKRNLLKNLWIVYVILLTACHSGTEVDILIIGGGASGSTAGIQAARMGKNTLIVEEHEWLGGALTSAGVSCIDGCYNLPSGLFGEFRNELIKHYGSEEVMHTAWVAALAAEPSAMNKALKDMAAREKNLSIQYNSTVKKITPSRKGWVVKIDQNGETRTIRTKVLIDGTELGDIAKMCGVRYDIGMEARDSCGESIAPEKANDIVQDITYVAILKDYGKDVTIPQPENYDPSVFYCTCKTPECTHPKEADRVWECDRMMEYGKLPNNKYMINWPIEGNDFYVNLIEMSTEERNAALEKAKNFTLCYLYYLQKELGYNTLGLADDEYPTADKLPFIPYHRESRRIHGKVRFTLNHIAQPYTQQEKLYRTCIAVGDYPVDHHHARYQGWAELPNLYFYPVPSFGLPLGTLLPEDVENLIVTEKSISVSNLANGTTRVQPVLMQIGQAAGALAALAVEKGESPSAIPVREVQNVLLDANGYLLPYLDLPVNDQHFKALQRIGSTGILKGRGANFGWANQTWFDGDSLLTKEALLPGLKEYYPEFNREFPQSTITLAEAFNLMDGLKKVAGGCKNNLEGNSPEKQWDLMGLTDYNPTRNITRKEFAVLLDTWIDPFNNVQINIKGDVKRAIK
ncbi:FAD-dependent oxidoreductase [Parabacteroides pacaensis]|uniref:FAD-dependent oxidoreductase n=1 Tax=Parabacteroides pacaensis TaxID=2086575 RepID=UPI000D0F584D|nr:FAD-dependent oxidoreductase [Parabacteroides pacaensis]